MVIANRYYQVNQILYFFILIRRKKLIIFIQIIQPKKEGDFLFKKLINYFC